MEVAKQRRIEDEEMDKLKKTTEEYDQVTKGLWSGSLKFLKM